MFQTTFELLARAVRDMLHIDNKTMMNTARGQAHLLGRARASQFVQVWNSLADRSTSEPDELHYILAILTDLRTQPLKGMSLNARIESIINSFEYLPVGLLFAYDPSVSGRSLGKRRLLPSAPGGEMLDSMSLIRVLDHAFELCIDKRSSDAVFYIL